MTQDQITSLLRWFLSVGGPIGAWLIAHKYASADDLTVIATSLIALVGAVPPLVSFVWSMFAHSETGTIMAAAALTDVQKITVAPSATADSAAGTLASDTSVPKVTK